MGCSSSISARGMLPGGSDPLEDKLTAAVITAKSRITKRTKTTSFNTLMLKFHKLRPGFLKIRGIFKEVARGHQSMTWLMLRDAHANGRLGMGSTDAVTEALSVGHPGGREPLAREDLLTLYTIVYLLEGNPAESHASISFREVVDALAILEEAFTYFDSSANGTLDKDEVARTTRQGTKVMGRAGGQSTSDQLFDQLDWDGSGQVTFKEFLTGIERMVVEAEDDDDDEDEFQQQYSGTDAKNNNAGVSPPAKAAVVAAPVSKPKPAATPNPAAAAAAAESTWATSQKHGGRSAHAAAESTDVQYMAEEEFEDEQQLPGGGGGIALPVHLNRPVAKARG